jgi:hypothetical protein
LLWLAALVNVPDQALKTNADYNRNLFEGAPERLLNPEPGFIC